MATPGFIRLDECVTDYLTESEQGVHKYVKLWHLAFRALTELGLDAFFRYKTVNLPVAANKTAQLPADCLAWRKFGVFNQKGEVVPLVRNENLSNYAALQGDRLDRIESDLAAEYVFCNYWDGKRLTPLYGLPSGAPVVGTFRVDQDNGLVLLDPGYAYDHVLLEYMPSPEQGGDYFLPVQFREAVIAYLRWKDIVSTPVKTHVQNAGVQLRRHDFYNERRLAIARYKPFRAEEAHQLNLENIRKTLKG